MTSDQKMIDQPTLVTFDGDFPRAGFSDVEGRVTLEADGKRSELEVGDAFVIPPGLATRLGDASPEFEYLEVSLPGAFETTKSAG